MKRNIRDSYQKYYETATNPVDIKTYLLITGEYNKFLIKKVLEGHKITLPSRMGTLCISGKKQRMRYDEYGNIHGLAPDWVGTKKLWEENEEARKNKKLVYHINLDTDNVRYKFLWSKLQVLVENKTLYSLRMTRANKRAAHNMIKQGRQYITKN